MPSQFKMLLFCLVEGMTIQDFYTSLSGYPRLLQGRGVIPQFWILSPGAAGRIVLLIWEVDGVWIAATSASENLHCKTSSGTSS